MSSFDANIQPIEVPTLASTATAAEIATFNATFVKNIVDTGNSLLSSYIDLKETDFFAVGELPEIWQQWFSSDVPNYQRFNERPDTNRPTISYADIENALDQLNALQVPTEPTLSPVSGNLFVGEFQSPFELLFDGILIVLAGLFGAASIA